MLISRILCRECASMSEPTPKNECVTCKKINALYSQKLWMELTMLNLKGMTHERVAEFSSKWFLRSLEKEGILEKEHITLSEKNRKKNIIERG